MRTTHKVFSAPSLLVVALVWLVLLAGCGDDDETASTDTTAASTTSADDAAAGDAAAGDDTEAADGDETADAGGDEAAGDEAESDYPPFEEADPTQFFDALADTDLVESNGEQEIYERGVTICRDFDNGTTVEREIDRLLAAGFGEETPLLMAAAVTAICPQHVDAPAN